MLCLGASYWTQLLLFHSRKVSRMTCLHASFANNISLTARYFTPLNLNLLLYESCTDVIQAEELLSWLTGKTPAFIQLISQYQGPSKSDSA